MVSGFVSSLRGGTREAHEAALTLGLLIERERVKFQSSDPDADIRAILGDEVAAHRLSEQELHMAVRGLIDYVVSEPDPLPIAVWALSKSYDQTIIPALIDLLSRTAADPRREALAYQALVGISTFDDAAVRSAIDAAAERGHGSVRKTARELRAARHGLGT